MRWTLYKDQEDCVNRCMDYINSYDKSPAIAVLPTGSGKSLIVSEIAERIGGGLLVLHLSSDLLSQNLEKSWIYRSRNRLAECPLKTRSERSSASDQLVSRLQDSSLKRSGRLRCCWLCTESSERLRAWRS